MNRRFVLLIVLVLGAAVFGALAVRSFARPAADLDRLKDATLLKAELGLTDEQVARIQALQKDYVGQLEDCCESHCAAREQLGKVMFSGSDTNELAVVVEKMCRAQLASDMATVAHIRKVHEGLTPEQQKKYEQMVTGCMCSACPSGFRHEP